MIAPTDSIGSACTRGIGDAAPYEEWMGVHLCRYDVPYNPSESPYGDPPPLTQGRLWCAVLLEGFCVKFNRAGGQ